MLNLIVFLLSVLIAPLTHANAEANYSEVTKILSLPDVEFNGNHYSVEFQLGSDSSFTLIHSELLAGPTNSLRAEYDMKSNTFTVRRAFANNRYYSGKLIYGSRATYNVVDLKEIHSINWCGSDNGTEKPADQVGYEVGNISPSGGIIFSPGIEAQPCDLNIGGQTYEGYWYSFGTLRNYYTWYEAMTYARNAGSGWRLPTKEELDLLYQNQRIVQGFEEDGYWSSTETSDTVSGWVQFYFIGNQYISSKTQRHMVRLVRNL